MKYATPRQRMKIYEKMIERIDAGEIFFMCNVIDEVVGASISYKVFEMSFPELWSLKPSGSLAWYGDDKNGMGKRRLRLLEAIELCKKELER